MNVENYLQKLSSSAARAPAPSVDVVGGVLGMITVRKVTTNRVLATVALASLATAMVVCGAVVYSVVTWQAPVANVLTSLAGAMQ
jgi:hypothetical protein